MHYVAQLHWSLHYTYTTPLYTGKTTTQISCKTYRFLVWHEGLYEQVELVSLQDLLQVHFRQHHTM